MEFTEKDHSLGCYLNPGDILYDTDSGCHLQVKSIDEDEGDLINARVYNLDEDDYEPFLIDPDETYTIYDAS